MGNRGEALRVFGKCRELFRDELGADPSRRPSGCFWRFCRAGQIERCVAVRRADREVRVEKKGDVDSTIARLPDRLRLSTYA